MKVIITAGGTGGHIYPALSIINELKVHEKDLEILFIGTHNRMEKDIIPARDIPYESLEIYGLSKKDLFQNFKNIHLVMKATKKSKKIMKEFNPDIVIGVGGYVTYPVIKAANALNIPTMIHEQNKIPGKSNKLLGKMVDAIAVSFPSSKDYFEPEKVVVTGNPCGETALKTKPITKKSLGITSRKKLVTIVAGSLGSQTLNDKIVSFLKGCKNENFEVIYITGKSFYASKRKFSENVHVLSYLDNLAGLMKNTDVLISRAGASTISEIIALQVPSILIPSPYVANNHQYYNALDLHKNKACELIQEKDLTNETLMSTVKKLLEDEKYYEQKKKNLKKLEQKDSAKSIYKLIKELTK